MREQQPSQVQHPKYDVDSLLNCQHDLSHAGDHVQYKNNQTALLGKLKLFLDRGHIFGDICKQCRPNLDVATAGFEINSNK